MRAVVVVAATLIVFSASMNAEPVSRQDTLSHKATRAVRDLYREIVLKEDLRGVQVEALSDTLYQAFCQGRKLSVTLYHAKHFMDFQVTQDQRRPCPVVGRLLLLPQDTLPPIEKMYHDSAYVFTYALAFEDLPRLDSSDCVLRIGLFAERLPEEERADCGYKMTCREMSSGDSLVYFMSGTCPGDYLNEYSAVVSPSEDSVVVQIKPPSPSRDKRNDILLKGFAVALEIKNYTIVIPFTVDTASFKVSVMQDSVLITPIDPFLIDLTTPIMYRTKRR